MPESNCERLDSPSVLAIHSVPLGIYVPITSSTYKCSFRAICGTGIRSSIAPWKYSCAGLQPRLGKLPWLYICNLSHPYSSRAHFWATSNRSPFIFFCSSRTCCKSQPCCSQTQEQKHGKQTQSQKAQEVSNTASTQELIVYCRT